MNRKFLIIGIAVYLVSTVASYLLFSSGIFSSIKNATSPVPAPKKTAKGVLFDESLPKTEACPLNGAKFSKQQRKWWEKHAPLGVMIENSTDARPQSGVSSADIVYEAIAEGGITRFLAIYYCQDAPFVGPVRSARTYFVDFISEYGSFPLYAHVGGANCDKTTRSGCLNGAKADAIGQIEQYGWRLYNDMDQFGTDTVKIGDKKVLVFLRDYDRMGRTVATEHTMYSSTTKLWEYAAKNRKITNESKDGEKWDDNFTPYPIKEEENLDARPASQTISHEFWDGYSDFAVTWKYDKASNSYLRSNGGVPHTDLNTKKQLSSKNVVILFMKESRANDGYEGNLHMLYGTKGTGNALVYMDGEEIEATWSKKNRTAHLFIKDKRGKDIEFNPGQIWFSVVSPDTIVTAK